MRSLRYWLMHTFLELARRSYPGTRPAYAQHLEREVWQIIVVPRRISETEAVDIAAQVQNL